MQDALKYLVNCFLLLVPVLLWNIVLVDKLPAAMQSSSFWSGVPNVIAYGENISRMVIVLLPLFMPLAVRTPEQKVGLVLYIIGVSAYVVSWIVLIAAPTSAWSNSLWGFMAPAVTPLVWLSGIGLIGESLFFEVNYRKWVYVAASLIFVVFHSAHTWIVATRVNGAVK